MIISYKCPNCGSDMAFDSDSGSLSCGSCGRQDNIESLPKENIAARFLKMRQKNINVKTAVPF